MCAVRCPPNHSEHPVLCNVTLGTNTFLLLLSTSTYAYAYIRDTTTHDTARRERKGSASLLTSNLLVPRFYAPYLPATPQRGYGYDYRSMMKMNPVCCVLCTGTHNRQLENLKRIPRPGGWRLELSLSQFFSGSGMGSIAFSSVLQTTYSHRCD